MQLLKILQNRKARTCQNITSTEASESEKQLERREPIERTSVWRLNQFIGF